MRSALLLLGVLAAGGARAEDRWTDPYPGVRHLARADRYAYDDRPHYRLQALVVDLQHPQVRVVATPPDQAGGTVSQFADRLGADVAWNTNFFGSPQDSCGLMMGEGQIWPRAYQDACHASVGFGDDGRAAVFVQPNPQGPPPEGWMRQVATGKPGPILVAGEPQFRYGCGAQCAYNPRTGLGLSQDRRTLYVVVVDGRQDGSVGAGLDDLANLMRDLGAWDAVNLDGGGSSTLYVRGEGGVQNRPSDGRERTVCCHMGLRVLPEPPPPVDAAAPPPPVDAAPPAPPPDAAPPPPDAAPPSDGAAPDRGSRPLDAGPRDATPAPRDAGPRRDAAPDAARPGDPVRPRGADAGGAASAGAGGARHDGGCAAAPAPPPPLFLLLAVGGIIRSRRGRRRT